jgi:hypothetical protein
MKVNVHINQSERRFLTNGYYPGDPLALALSFEAEAESALVLCDRVFAALNSPGPVPVGTLDAVHIAAYHKVYPSLSVGDIVEVDGKRYVCQTAGWLPLETTGPKFPMGRFVATPGAFALGIDLQALLARHASGDWGDLCAEDLATNEHGLAHGERLFSSYKTEKGTVWIMTERDRSVTTVLLPSEY